MSRSGVTTTALLLQSEAPRLHASAAKWDHPRSARARSRAATTSSLESLSPWSRRSKLTAFKGCPTNSTGWPVTVSARRKMRYPAQTVKQANKIPVMNPEKKLAQPKRDWQSLKSMTTASFSCSQKNRPSQLLQTNTTLLFTRFSVSASLVLQTSSPLIFCVPEKNQFQKIYR